MLPPPPGGQTGANVSQNPDLNTIYLTGATALVQVLLLVLIFLPLHVFTLTLLLKLKGKKEAKSIKSKEANSGGLNYPNNGAPERFVFDESSKHTPTEASASSTPKTPSSATPLVSSQNTV